MSGVIKVKCAECGFTTNYIDLYKNGKLCVNHRMDCSQQGVAYQRRLTLTQAEIPSSPPE
jgi:hypothetical protein